MDVHEIAIQSFKYVPPEKEVKKGDKVIWTNKDGIEHTVTAADKAFDSGDILEEPFEHIFETLGEFPYTCSHHGGMKGKIIVVDAEANPKPNEPK